MNCSKCQKSFFSTPEFINHVDQHHGASTLRFGTKCYTRDPTDYLFHCNLSGCEQVLVHRQDFQNQNAFNATQMDDSHTERDLDTFTTVSAKGNMAWKDPLTFFSSEKPQHNITLFPLHQSQEFLLTDFGNLSSCPRCIIGSFMMTTYLLRR